MFPTPLVGVIDAGEAWPRPYLASVVNHPDTGGLAPLLSSCETPLRPEINLRSDKLTAFRCATCH